MNGTTREATPQAVEKNKITLYLTGEAQVFEEPS